MKTKEKKELQNKTIEELRKQLSEARGKQNEVRLLLSQFKAKNTRELFLKRKEVAQILTVLNLKEKEMHQNGNNS